MTGSLEQRLVAWKRELETDEFHMAHLAPRAIRLIEDELQREDSTRRTVRIEARISAEAKRRIEQAASLAGASVSSFVVDAAVRRADEVLDRFQTTEVSSNYFDELLAALDTES